MYTFLNSFTRRTFTLFERNSHFTGKQKILKVLEENWDFNVYFFNKTRNTSAKNHPKREREKKKKKSQSHQKSRFLNFFY